MISYAQNFEDVMLFRALRHIERGQYIDVGAHDPHEFSVTKLFYDRGWRGINIEPVPRYHTALVQARTEDRNLAVAAGAAAGLQRLHVVEDTGLSTLVAEYAERAEERGFRRSELLVPVITLDDVCAELVDPEVHFLKIDVEGSEADVLRGFSFDAVRPWIVLVEATKPGTPETVHGEWERLLLDHAYRFVYFDGLNRFYVSDEHSELAAAFDAPPNVFDEFVTAGQHEATERARALEVAKDALDAKSTELSRACATSHAELARIDAWLDTFAGSANPARGADSRLPRMAARFDALVTATESFARELAAMNADLTVMRESLAAASASCDAARGELAREAAGHRSTQTALDALRVDLARETEQHLATHTELQHVRAKTVARLAEVEAVGASLEARVATLTEELEQQHAMRGMLEQEVTRLSASNRTLESELRDSAHARDASAADYSAAAAALAKAETTIRAVSAELRASQELAATLTAIRAELSAENDAIRASWSWRLTGPLRRALAAVRPESPPAVSKSGSDGGTP